ncbi:MAG: hypothetical protein HHAS10_11300 [Candidatus Altimarinota bacterium]
MQCDNPKIVHHLPHIFDRGDVSSLSFNIGKNECQKYLFVPEVEGVYERHFCLEEGAVFRGGAIVLGANMVLKMFVSIQGSNSEASLQLLGLAKGGSNIEIDGIGIVKNGCEGVKLRVDQTNILLGKGAKVRGRPVLEVGTDSIEGGHSCKVHEISGEKLFYLESHGIDTKTAEQMLLEGEIMNHLMIISTDYENIRTNILGRLL